MLVSPPHRRRLTTAAVVAVVALVFAPTAHAGPLVAEAGRCPAQTLEQPFLRWADPANYMLVPNGVLEGARAWSLKGAAETVRGNEHFYVHDEDDDRSLALPAASSATTSVVCVGIEYPSLRFFARNKGSSNSTLLVEVLYEDASGQVRLLPIGSLTSGSSWQPTVPLPLLVNLLPLLPDEKTPVKFRFTPQGAGEWSVDDIYVDPWRHR